MNVVNLPREEPCNVLGMVAFAQGVLVLLEGKLAFVDHRGLLAS